jgi:hypothetical protein
LRLAKARFDDREITIRDVSLAKGEKIPVGTNGFVIEGIDVPDESDEVEFYVEDDSIPGDERVLATVGPQISKVA